MIIDAVSDLFFERPATTYYLLTMPAFIASGSVPIGCRLGHYGNTTTGKARFDNLTLIKE
jgi:hypothetical protein